MDTQIDRYTHIPDPLDDIIKIIELYCLYDN